MDGEIVTPSTWLVGLRSALDDGSQACQPTCNLKYSSLEKRERGRNGNDMMKPSVLYGSPAPKPRLKPVPAPNGEKKRANPSTSYSSKKSSRRQAYNNSDPCRMDNYHLGMDDADHLVTTSMNINNGRPSK